jgi:cob(I)alamin adenosyltransferase
MSDRIKSNYKKSNGDVGVSLILNGHNLPKNHSSADIYAENEWLLYSINKFLLKYDLKYEYLKYILNWLKENSFSLGAFAFNLGNTERHSLPTDFLVELNNKVEELEHDEMIGSSKDFVVHNKEIYVALDGIRIIVRDTERAYLTWNEDWIVNKYLLETTASDPLTGQKIASARLDYSAFLNRLSKFIWLATRKEAEMCGHFNTQTIWKGGINN